MSDFMDTHQIVHHGDITDHFVNGDHVSTGFKGVFHSREYFTDQGQHETAIKNVFGGKDVCRDGKLHERTVPDGRGGDDIYDGMMQMKGSLHPNVHGGHDLVAHGNVVESSIPGGHGVSTVLNFHDPLMNLSEYTVAKLTF
jgi:hypothetical protein